MRFSLQHIAFLILSTLAWADGPSDLRGSLQRLQGHAPVQMNLDYATAQDATRNQKTQHSEGSIRLRVGEDGSGLHVDWNLRELEAANREEDLRDLDSHAPTPLRDAMKDLDAGRLNHILNQAEVLSHLLDGTQFKEERNEAYQGRSARVLEFTFKPRIASAYQDRASHAKGMLKIWIGGDGLPLATESQMQYDGRHGRFFGLFSVHSRIETTYAVLGGRLVVASRTSEDFLSDSGDELKSKKTLTLTEVRP